MFCPNCGRDLSESEVGVPRCPGCGAALPLAGGVLKTSTVRVAAGGGDQIYPSVEALPDELRRQLQRAIDGPDSETIWIADQAGREKILQAVLRLPPELQKKVFAALRGLPAPPEAPRRPGVWRVALIAAAASLLALWLAWLWLR